MRVLMISRSSLYEVPGGDTVQIVETAKALKLLGVQVDIKLADEKIDYSNYDLLHFFNIIRPNMISYHTKKTDLPFVISTIFVDYTEVERKYRGLVFRSLSRLLGADGMEYMKTLARLLKNGESILDNSYLLKGHKKSIEELLNKASCLLPNSESEYNRLKAKYRFQNQHLVVPNAVSNDFLKDSSESIDRKGLLCVGRIEVIKNQLNLIKAVNGTGIPLKLIGKAAPNHMNYYEQCKELADENVSFLGQLSKEEVIQEMRQAKAHILPSFFETTGLSSLEAAACGCNIIVTPKGDTKEYFGEKAIYCEPDQIESIRSAIQKAMSLENNLELKNFVSENYNWNKAAEVTKSAYDTALKHQPN